MAKVNIPHLVPGEVVVKAIDVAAAHAFRDPKLTEPDKIAERIGELANTLLAKIYFGATS